ncbi:DUF4340 domain-containing protein [Aliiglaciecola sp. LCG003]|uniref:DUF4340 domain-containing protein n=1 Tax=Aliiglaciecola sp. LCG003 TaxID=3053655 RepID=UPI00257488F7|nr:DUF4340 domain-containing protein [Aliiglaciecola sp. LCG003]WJG08511.1 DUF4340 domain-containing protein [Aliiglaciecola sp. LCG003]
MNRQLIALVAILATVGAAIYYLLVQSNNQVATRALLFPNLTQQAANIDFIEVTQPSGRVFNATKKASDWITALDEVGVDYPMEQARLAELVENLATAILFEAKTTKPENYEHLGLQDITQADSQATEVSIRAGGSQYRILIGANASSGQGSYVRLTDESQTWLLNKVIDLPSNQYDWLKQPILNIDVSQVDSMVRIGDGGFSIIKSSGGEYQFQLTNLSSAQSLKYDSIVDGFVTNLMALDFEKILGVDSATWQELPVVAGFQISLSDGTVIEASLRQEQHLNYIMFTALGGQGGDYWDGLVYQISSFNAGQIGRTLADFVEQTKGIDASQTMSTDEGESPSN